MRSTGGPRRDPNRSRTVGRLAIAAAVFVALLTSAASVGAAGVAAPQNLSGTDPEAACPAQPTEIEPAIAINPTDRRNVVVVWDQQDSAGFDLVAAASVDGGRTWQQAIVPGLTMNVCAVPDHGGGSIGDPSLSFGPDGTLYLAAMRYNTLAANVETVVTSRNRGLPLSWSPPVDIGSGDRGTIVADPIMSGVAYIAEAVGAGDMGTSVAVQRSTDGGRTWSQPVIAYPSTNGTARAPVIAVVGHNSNGAADLVVALAGGIDTNICCHYTTAARSNDGGATWEAPQTPAGGAETNDSWATDPDGGAPASFGFSRPSLAASAPGEAFMAWSNVGPDGPDSGQVLISRMTTEPRANTTSWSAPVVVNPATAGTSQVLDPEVAVLADGTITVIFYDDRNDIPGDDKWTADLWLATSRDHGTTWQEAHVAGPFDLRAAEQTFTDYVGLAARDDNLFAAFNLGPGIGGAVGATEGNSDQDVFFARLLG